MTAIFAVEGLSGVKKADDDTDKHTLTITYDDRKVSLDVIKEALIKANHKIEGTAEILP